MRTTLICLLDKKFPPDHSFVTGMLAQALPRDGDVRVQLLVIAPESGPLAPRRYHRAACLPMIPDFSRRGGSRVRAMLTARHLARALIDKARRRGERVVLFVRNHPVLLLAAASLRGRADGLVFQSSFPLELQGNIARRGLHQAALRVGGRRVDGVLAVSPLGLERAQGLCSGNAQGLVVPLLSDLPRASAADSAIWGGDNGSVRFIYVGTHRAHRRLDVVLAGVVGALNAGANAAFVFVGGKPEEIAALRRTRGVRRWEGKGRIVFIETVPRPRLPGFLEGADVGLSLVPETKINREMSPTKLAEYMGAGLAVLASRGVDLQETFMGDSRAGVLVPFDAQSIADAIGQMCADQRFVDDYKECAENFAETYLKYSRYVSEFTALISETQAHDSDNQL